MPGHAPKSVQGPGFLEVGLTEKLSHVRVQFHDPDWWADFTVREARLLGNLLLRKAKELERERRGAVSS